MRAGKASLAFAALLVLGAGLYRDGALAAAKPSPQALVNAAYAAMGGDKLARLKTIGFKAHLQQWDPGESYSLARPEEPRIGAADVTVLRDLARGLARKDYVLVKDDDKTVKKFVEIVTPNAGYVIGNDANAGRLPKRATAGDNPEHTMSGPRLTFSLRELERDSAVLEMKLHPERVAAVPDQTAVGKTFPAAQLNGEYGRFIVLFDPATHLPVRVRSRDWDALEGDSDFDSTYSDWRDVEGVKLPFHVVQTLNAFKIADTVISDVMLSPQAVPASFAIPPAMLAKAEKPAPPETVPMQWIVRRKFSGFYLDSAAYYYDDGGSMVLNDIAPAISQTAGATHNTLFIDAGTYLIAVEAPNDDGQSKLALALAAKKYPGKPIKYLILTHHHVDHVGGMRSYAALGATIIVGPGDGAYFRRVLARPETLNPNAPAAAFTAKVVEANGKWSPPDGGREVDVLPIANPHAADMVIVYVPDAKLGIVTDLWNPGPPVTTSNPMLASVVHGVRKWGIRPERFAGGHGTVSPYAEAEQAVEKAEAK